MTPQMWGTLEAEASAFETANSARTTSPLVDALRANAHGHLSENLMGSTTTGPAMPSGSSTKAKGISMQARPIACCVTDLAH